MVNIKAHTCCVVDNVFAELSKFGRPGRFARGILHPLGLFNFSSIIDGDVGTSAASLMSNGKRKTGR